MKSLFPYLVMCVLFLAGNRLVDRQQQYNRSNQTPVSVKSNTFSALVTTDTTVPNMQLTNGDDTPSKRMIVERRAAKTTPRQ